MLSDDMVSQGVSTGDGLAAVGAEVARVIHMSTQSYIPINKEIGSGPDPTLEEKGGV